MHLRFQKIQIAVLKGTIAITQVTSGLVKLKNNRELTAKDIRKPIIFVIKTCTEAVTVSWKPGSRLHKEGKHCHVIIKRFISFNKGCVDTFSVAF